MQVTPRSRIFGILLVHSFTTPASPHGQSFDANLGTLTIQYSYRVAVFPRRVTTVNTYSNVAVCKTYFHTLYLIFNDTFALLVIDRALPSIVDNPTLARCYLCGVAVPVYLN